MNPSSPDGPGGGAYWGPATGICVPSSIVCIIPVSHIPLNRCWLKSRGGGGCGPV